jgi:hypothetical protein
MPKLYRQPSERRIARVALLRNRQVHVITRDGYSHRGRVLAVGVALHGTSTDWLALANPDNSIVDRFISLATIETIEPIGRSR